ncbi:MAG: GNAT family N-acetyltransferase [Candidatus Hodarchaeales archaeon]|jgi:ribosomal protein S18 acetylase RimI-like enzyme
MAVKISFRDGKQEDLEFLFYLKTQTLKEYVAQIWGWDEDFQYDRHRHSVNPEVYTIIQASDEDIGCFAVEIHPDKLFLSVIEILPAFQNQGVGSRLIRDLIKQGEQEGKNIELQVLKVNQRAFQLYRSLGFATTNETDTHYQMLYSVNKS